MCEDIQHIPEKKIRKYRFSAFEMVNVVNGIFSHKHP